MPVWYTETFEDALTVALGTLYAHGMKCRVTKGKYNEWKVTPIRPGSVQKDRRPNPTVPGAS